jgi:hypothetical protein
MGAYHFPQAVAAEELLCMDAEDYVAWEQKLAQ